MRALAVLWALAFACTGCDDPMPGFVKITGELIEYAEGSVFLYGSSDRFDYRDWTATLDTSMVDKDGLFEFQYEALSPDYYQLVGQDGYALAQDLYLEPGDSIHVTIPVRSDTARVSYSGARAGAYACGDRLNTLWRADTAMSKRYYEIARMEIDSAWQLFHYKWLKRRMVIDSHFTGHSEWAPLRDRYAFEAACQYAQDHFQYMYYHRYYTEDTFVYFVPEIEYYSFLDSIDMSSAPGYYSTDYHMFLQALVRDLVYRDYSEMDDSTRWSRMMTLQAATIKKHLTGTVHDEAFIAIARDFPHYLSNDDFFDVLDSIDIYLASHYTDEVAYRNFRYIKSDFERLKPGNPAPELALPDPNGDTVSLGDLTGKVVYLDFWGTWCYPCLQEMPHSLELQEKFAEDPVAFVFVGLESGVDQITEWREFINGERSFDYAPFLEQRVYPGIHLLSEGQFNNPALKPFHIRAAPTYMLIDGQGRIVSANAPRPGDEAIEGLIREALSGL